MHVESAGGQSSSIRAIDQKRPAARPAQSGHDPQQRALARAIAAQHADLGAGIERQLDVFENLSLTILFGQVGDLVDELFAHDLVC